MDEGKEKSEKRKTEKMMLKKGTWKNNMEEEEGVGKEKGEKEEKCGEWGKIERLTWALNSPSYSNTIVIALHYFP